jgi:hypothetical protein
MGERELQIGQHCYHSTHDIGVVRLSESVDYEFYPYFGPSYVLDNILTMGYPPLRGMKEAALRKR